MFEFFICLIISIMLSFGFAILLTEKGNEWPIKRYRVYLQLFLRKIHYKLPRMLYCTTCCSFHTTIISDLIVCIVALCCGSFYFFFPFSGCICASLTWVVIEYLNSIDKDQDINVFIDNKQ